MVSLPDSVSTFLKSPLNISCAEKTVFWFLAHQASSKLPLAVSSTS